MTCIMIIDDDSIILRSIEIALKREDYEVITAFHGEEGLKKLKTTKPDLILLDLKMVPIDGWKVLKEIKEQEDLAHIPVIILTVKEPTEKILADKDKLGFTDYMTKPFDLDDLFLKISMALHS